MLRNRIPVTVAVTALAGLALPGTALAHGGDGPGGTGYQVIRSQDDCEPESFTALLGPGACVGNGDTTTEEFVGQLQERGEAPKWRFDPDDTHIDHGEHLAVTGEGGEFHTFTEVQQFGGGCVEELNALLGLEPVPECADPSLFGTTGVAPGQTLHVYGLDPGTHMFQCLIHPWMHATVAVRQP